MEAAAIAELLQAVARLQPPDLSVVQLHVLVLSGAVDRRLAGMPTNMPTIFQKGNGRVRTLVDS